MTDTIRPQPANARPRQWPRTIILLIAFLLAVNAGVRLARLHADSPPLPNKFRNVAPYKDEGAKAHEARNRALFGAWQTNPRDNYRFWSTQAPVWTDSLYLWFRIFGVSYASLRVLSIVCALLTLLAGAVALHKAGFTTGALFFPVILGLNFYYLIFSRLGLMEPMVVLWLTLAAAFLAFSRNQAWNFIPATLFLLAGLLSKTSAFMFLPVWAAYALLLFLNKVQGPSPKRDKRIAIVFPALTAGLLLAITSFFLSPSFRSVAEMAFRHGFDLHEDIGQGAFMELLSNVVSSFLPVNLWRGYFMMLPSAALLGAGWALNIFWRAFKRQKVTDLEWICLAWFVIGRGAASAAPYQAVRFHLYYFAPLAILAAMAADHLWNLGTTVTTDNIDQQRNRKKRVLGRGLVAALLTYELLMTAVPWLQWVTNPRYDIVSASRQLGKVLESEELETGRGPVVIGEWAGPLSLENNMILHYVKGPFNDQSEQLAAFGITHLLENQDRYDPAVGLFSKKFPEIYQQKRLVAEFRVRDRLLKLWRVPLPPGNPSNP